MGTLTLHRAWQALQGIFDVRARHAGRAKTASKITIMPPENRGAPADNQDIVILGDVVFRSGRAMRDVTFSREAGLSAAARADSAFRNALYFAGLKIALFGSVCSVALFLISFFGGLGFFALNGKFLLAGLLWLVGGILFPLSLRLFQSPFALLGGALIRMSGKSIYTQLDRIPPHLRG